jgi:endonuclease YncB( thermonuclease family)
MTWEWPNSTVVRLVDGDTFDALLTRDLGFGGHVTFTVRLRLARINCPPLETTPGRLAAQAAFVLLMGAPVHITTLKPYKFGGPVESPGEWMAEVVLANGRNVSDELVAQGHAVLWDGTGARPDAWSESA